MPGWIIGSWDPVSRTGTLPTPYGYLPFGPEAAAVDHFEAGEAVTVEILFEDEKRTVIRVAPVAWRAPGPTVTVPPDLDAALRRASEALKWTDCIRFGSLNQHDGPTPDLVLDLVGYSGFLVGKLVFDGVYGLQLCIEIDHIMRLSVVSLPDAKAVMPSLAEQPENIGELLTFCLEPDEFDQRPGWVVAEEFYFVER